MTNLPIYTGLAAALLMLLYLALLSIVLRQRIKHNIDLGDGGIDSLFRAIRVQGNFVENVPLFLIGLGICEIIAGSNMVVGGLAGVFVIARMTHAVGLSMSSGRTPSRFLGTLVTMLSYVGVAGYLAWLCLSSFKV